MPSLPQNDSAAEQQARRAELSAQQQAYVYNFDSRLKPLGISAEVPKQDGASFVWLDGVATAALQLLGNELALAAKLFNNGEVLPEENAALSREDRRQVEDLYEELSTKFSELSGHVARLHQANRSPGTRVVSEIIEAPRELLKAAGHVLEDATGIGAVTRLAEEAALHPVSIARDIRESIEDLLKKLLSEAGEKLLAYLGQFGKASSFADYERQFSLLLQPAASSSYEDDLMFARMRLAGPNPLVIQGIAELPANFPVTEAQYQSAMGEGDSLARAVGERRLFLADYAVLQGMATGVTSGGQKYLEAPLALFAVPSAEQADRRLRPVAIQCSQTPGHSSPIFTPKDGTGWRLAKLHVQVADGNYHELISHLGLTHLVLEAFAMATPRQLAQQHPLYLLLTPHFEGTLTINAAAEGSLIAPGGPVDMLLSGTIEASTQLAVKAVEGHKVNQAFLPRALAARHVDDAAKLPDYPYRDDARLIWDDIHAWVGDYLAIYYNDDAAVRGDYELQNWVKELASPEGGGLKDIGEEGGGIQTFNYLVDLATYVIFTGSAQHAAVNFPQRTVMSYTPAMPLAAYAPAPTRTDEALMASAEFDHLPPLQMSMLQLLVGSALGGVYFTRLGQYDAYLRKPWFQDARVTPVLAAFQERLSVTGREIGRRNLSRTPYEALLPTAIPQSINI